MKKNLLLSMALCASLSGWAQTSYETALPLQEGENTYTCEETVQNLYWKYTPAEDMIVKVKPNGYDMVEMHTSVTDDAGAPSMKAINYAAFKYPEKGFALHAGETYYVVLTTYNTPGTVSFNYSICENSAGVGTGLTAEDPLVIIPGKEQFIGATYASNDVQTTYATYTATEDGLLKITSSAYVNSSSTINGSPLIFDSANEEYVASIPVTSGETYNFVFKGYNAYFFTSELTHPTAGSIDRPFELQTGANTVPAEAGEYWYSFTPVGTGYLTLSSESSLPGGKVELLSNKSYSATVTVEGSYNLRYELSYNSGNTMYVKVTKPEASAEPDILNYEMKDYAPGEKESNPQTIASVPAEVKVPAQTKYFFSLTTPAEQNGFLIVEAQEALSNTNTYVKIYKKASGSWSGIQGTNVTKAEILGGTEYIINCDNQEQNELTLNISYATIQDGDVITQPLTAQLGENSINGKGNRYYTYKASKACKVQVTVPEGVVVSFPKDASEYNIYDAYVNGQTSTLYAEGAQSYYIKLENCTGEGSFTIAEADYAAGDTKDLAIEVTDGVYNFGEEVPSCLWVKYTAAKSGKLLISSQVPFDYENTSMLLWTESSSYGNQLLDYTTYTYGGSINVIENQTIYIQVLSKIALKDYSLNFELKDPEPGEIPATAIDGTNGKVTVPVTEYGKEFWVKVDAKAGTLILKSTGNASGLLYEGLENAVNENSREYFSASNYDYNTGEVLDEYVFKTDLQEAGTYYFKFMYLYNSVDIWFEGDVATAINSIESLTQQGAEEVYDFRGMKLNGKSLKKGLYIIKKDGKSQKMLVK